jgi:hypothetical protein
MNPAEIITRRETDPGWDWDADVSAEIKMHIKRNPDGDDTTERLCLLFPCEAGEAYDELERWGAPDAVPASPAPDTEETDRG